MRGLNSTTLLSMPTVPLFDKLQEMGGLWTTRCGVPGRQVTKSPFNKLDSGVRVGRDVHET